MSVESTRERRTVMYFCVDDGESFGMEYMKRVCADMTYILWCRVVRKTPRDRIVGNCRLLTRQLKPKWHDRSGVTGMIEATASWEERL